MRPFDVMLLGLCMVVMVTIAASIECRRARAPKVKVVTPSPSVRRACSPDVSRIVQREWDNVYNTEDGEDRRLMIVQEILKRMFSTPVFKAHMMRLIVDLDLIINHLHDGPTLEEQLRHLSHRRNKYMGAHVGYFKAMTSALMLVLPDVAAEFNKLAWGSCLTYVGHTLTSESSKIRAEHFNNLPPCSSERSSSVGGVTSTIPEVEATASVDNVRGLPADETVPAPKPKARLYGGRRRTVWGN